MERKTTSIVKACELVGVSRRTIYNWLASGKIEYVRTAGGSVRIFVDTLVIDPSSERSKQIVEKRSAQAFRPNGLKKKLAPGLVTPGDQLAALNQ